MYKKLIFIFVLVRSYDGFLLDDKTQGTAKPTFSNDHFTIMLNLLTEERQSRVKLENRVMQLESELLSTQKGVTDIYHTGLEQNKTLKQQITNMESLSNTVSNLNYQYNLLLRSIGQLQLNQTSLNNLAAQITGKLDSLEHSKSALDIKMVLSIRNETTTLATKLQSTNNQLNLIQSDVNARKQDFVALFTKVDLTENKLNHSVLKIEKSVSKLANQSTTDLHNATSYVLSKINLIDMRHNSTITKLENDFKNRLKVLQNETSSELNAEIQKANNRVAFSSYAVSGTYSPRSIVPFKVIETIQGLSNIGNETIRQTGQFVCESQGLYLISVFILTNTHGTFAELYKNNQIIGFAAFSLNGHYQTSTLVILEHLAVNDTVYVKSQGNLHVDGSDHSCMSVLQII